MDFTFHVAHPDKIVKDATLGWYWMCTIDYQEEKKINKYTMKVNFVTLIGKRGTK